jgi:hypothetical protein
MAKNAFWWCSVLPFMVTTGSVETGVRNAILLTLTSAVYYWRARTEEEHLGADPAYRAYAAWMARHGLVPRFFALLTGKRPPQVQIQPAE